MYGSSKLIDYALKDEEGQLVLLPSMNRFVEINRTEDDVRTVSSFSHYKSR